jgi:2,3-bisphosphoglycerate-dependent phosphoglycerate mutase
VRLVWLQSVAAALASGKRVIITAHGNSLRALIKLIEGIPDDDIPRLEVANAVPIVFELDAALQVVRKSSLGNPTATPSEIL